MELLLKRTVVFIISILLFSSFSLQSFPESDLAGEWLTEKNEGTVEIFEKGGLYYGKLISLAEPNSRNDQPKKDTRNKDHKLRSRPLLGITVISDMKYDPLKRRWHNGTIYIPKVGYATQCVLVLKDRNTLLVKGYIGAELTGKTNTWKRK